MPGISIGSSVSKMLNLDVKVFYVMGKALTGELPCPVTGLVSFIMSLFNPA